MTPLRAVIPVFSLTLFLSAALLFWLEPMFGKMILPLLGGTPAVWLTAMLFYQLALLAGYAYAHATSRWLKPLPQAAAHLGLLLLALLTLPIVIPSDWTPPAEGNPVTWLLRLLTVALACPFVLLSATAPIVQRWFATTSHPQASNPYFLYAASNAGSLAGLMSYPLLLEPNFKLSDQSRAWSLAYIALVILVAGSAALSWRYRLGTFAVPTITNRIASSRSSSDPIGWRTLLHWLALAFVPSSLMLSVTSYITTDIAAVPMMWVLPLSLYLLSFIIAFSRKPLVTSAFSLWVQPFLILPLTIALVPVLAGQGGEPISFLPVHLAMFFISALVCNFALVRLRPAADQLTKYFLIVSLGGALGGAFNVIVAPLLFNNIYEYPLGIVAACLLRPWPVESIWRRKPVVLAALAAGAAILSAELLGTFYGSPPGWIKISINTLMAAGAVCLFITRNQPLWLGTGTGLYLLSAIMVPISTSLLYAERNFFGVISVRLSSDNTFHILQHGTTLHGVQALDPAHRLEPLSYYSRYGGMAEVLATIAKIKPAAKIGIIGLGAGSLVCYGNAAWHYTFYEIDPGIAEIARDPRLFSFLSDCGHDSDIVLGDGRLSIKKAADGYFDAIILDAFSSDVIPLHLLTQEAVGLYLRKISAGGVIAFHLSNRYFNLAPIVAATARDLGLVALLRQSSGGVIEGTTLPYLGSIVLVLARKVEDLSALAALGGWTPITARADIKSWTDDYSDLLQAFMLR